MYGDYPLIAPYWTDIDLRGGVGNVRYTVYTTENGSSYIDQVNAFLYNQTFTATMILVAQWIDVCPFGNQYCSEVSIQLPLGILPLKKAINEKMQISKALKLRGKI